MPLTNSQKSRIVKVAQENGYAGDYEELFTEAQTNGIFGEVPEPDVSEKKSDYNLDLDSVVTSDNIIPSTNFDGNSNGSTHMTTDHETLPKYSALKAFMDDPAYKRQPQQQAEKGGFEKQFNTNYQESQNYQRIKNSRKGSRYNPPPEETALTDEGSHSTHLMTDDKKNTAWPTLFQNKDGSWFELSRIDAYKEATRRDEIYEFDSKEEMINFARKGDWKEKGGFKKYNAGGSVDLLDESKLNIVTESYDPWEYTKDAQGQIHTRKKAVGENGTAGDWIQPKKGSVSYNAIKEQIVFDVDAPNSIGGLDNKQTAEVQEIYKKDPANAQNKLQPEIQQLLYRQTSNTADIQQMLVDSKYYLGTSGDKGNGVDGDWGTKTTAAFSEWSSKNLNNLPIYEGKRQDICQQGSGCSEKVTNMLMDLFPGVQRDDLGPEDAWYRAKHVVELGGEKLWGVSDSKAKGYWDKLPDLPPVEIWKNLQIGDLVHLNRKGGDKANKESASGYNIDMNRSTEHVGFIIGRDEATGLPLIMHGGGDKMEVDKINEIALKNHPSLGDYKIDAITRSKGTKDRKPNLKDHYIYNSNKTDKLSSNLTKSNNPLNQEEYFATRFVNTINDNVDRMANTTGYSKEAVVEASRLAYGIFKNETGTWYQILKGGAKEFAKNNINAELLADVATGLGRADQFIESGSLSAFDYIAAPKTDETSIGAGRIKFEMQTKDPVTGHLNKVGQWYKGMNITEENLDFGADNFIDKSFNAITLQVLSYTEKAKKHKEYDPKTNTVAGVPLQYVISTMHKSPYLYGKVDANHSVLDYLKKGDRDYANNVLKNSEDINVEYHDDNAGDGEYSKAQAFKAKKAEERKQKEEQELEANAPTIEDYIRQSLEAPSDKTATNRPIIPNIK
jgi:hypothetical protein